MAAISTTILSHTGLAPTFVACATAGDSFGVGTGHNTTVLFANATTDESRVVTFASAPWSTSQTPYGVNLPAHTVTVAADSTAYVMVRNDFADGSSRATATYSDHTDLSVAVVQVS